MSIEISYVQTDNPHGPIFTNSLYISHEINYAADIKLLNGWTSIGDGAFQNMSSLTNITISNTVSNIGISAFQNVINLTSIIIPESVTSIGSNAFSGCSNLTSITIGKLVDNIGNNAFHGCSSLVNIIVDVENSNYLDVDGVLFNEDRTVLFQYPIGNLRTTYDILNSVITITEGAFEGCINLEEIKIPDTVEIIGTNAFRETTQLTTLTIDSDNSKLLVIGINAFRNTSRLSTIIIPRRVAIIGENAFTGMLNLVSFNLNSSNDYFNTDSYGVLFTKNYTRLIYVPNNNNIVTYTVLDSVTTIDEYAFQDCSKLTEILVDSANINYSSLDGVLFNKNQSLLIQYPPGNTNLYYTIPDSTTTIGKYAFYGASNIESLTIPSGCSYDTMIDYSGMSSLKEIELSEQNRTLRVDDNILFNENYSILYKYPAQSSRTTYEIPSTVTMISTSAFDSASSLTSVTIATNNITIFPNAFKNSALTDVIINESTNISYVDNSIDLYIGPNQLFYGKHNVYVRIITKILTGVQNLLTGTRQLQLAVKGILSGYNTFSDNAFKTATTLTEIVIPYTVTSIGASAFQECSSLHTVTFGRGEDNTFLPKLNIIRNRAFQDCVSLTSIVIPKTVVSIEDYAFQECNNLTSITFEEGSILNSIGKEALYDCNKLSTIIIPASTRYIADNAFYSCDSLTSIIFEESTLLDNIASAIGNVNLFGKVEIPVSIQSKIFTGMNSFNQFDITLLQNATRTEIKGYSRIEANAFYNCLNLTHITISPSVTYIADNAFSTLRLKGITFEESTNLSLFNKSVGEYDNLFGATKYNDSTLIKVSIITKVYTGATDSIESTGANELTDDIVKGVNIEKTLDGATRVRIENYTSIGENAFNGCTNLSYVYIPASVTSIQKRAFYNITTLTSITFEKNTRIETIESDVFEYSKNLTHVIFENSAIFDSNINNTNLGISIGNEQDFFGANNVNIYVITKIFEGSGVLLNASSLFITDSAVARSAEIIGYTSIGDNAFKNALNLTSIVISDSITSIGKNAFLNCIGLNNITISAYMNGIGISAFQNCSNITAITFNQINNGNLLTIIGTSAFESCSNLLGLNIPNSVTSIGENAFQNCNELSTIILPNTLKKLEANLFYNCSRLNSIMIPSTVTRIGEKAFYGCSGLNEITIPDSVINIEDSAFFGCTRITSFKITDLVAYIGQRVFQGCSRLTELTIPPYSEVISIGQDSFRDTSLHVVKMGIEDVTRLLLNNQLNIKTDNPIISLVKTFVTFYGKRNVNFNNNTPLRGKIM